MKTDLFQSCGHWWVFQICWHIECSTFTACVHIFVQKYLFWDIGSYDYWSWEDQRFSACNWRPGKARNVFWRPQSHKAGCTRTLMPHFNSQAKSESDLPLTFFFFPWMKPSEDWMISTFIGEGSQLHSVHQFKYQFLLQIPSQTHPEIMFNQVSGYSTYQLSWYTELTNPSPSSHSWYL